MTPKLRFKGFTDPWEQRKLGDVLEDMYNGQTPSRNKDAYWKGDISWLSGGELNRGIVSESIEKITMDGKQSANLKIVPKGTFVMAVTGLEAPVTRGNCAMLGFDTTLNQSCMALFPKKDLLGSEFLFQWYLKFGEVYGINYTQGTKQQNYSAEVIKILPITLPSIEEQNKISEYLFKIDNLITLHQREVDTLTNIKKGLMQKIFSQEIKFKSDDGSEFPDWVKEPMKNLGSFSKKGTLVKKDALGSLVPCVLYGHVYTDYNEVIDFFKYYTDSNKNVFAYKNDVLFPASTTGDAESLISPSSVEVEQIALGRDIIVFRPQNNVSGKYISYLINNIMRKEFAQHAQGSSVIHIQIKNLEKIFISIPCLEEQKKITDCLSAMDAKIALARKELETLKSIKKGFLQQMFV